MASTATNYIYRMGTAPNTRSAVSQKNKVFSYAIGNKGFLQLGAISEFSHDEGRTIDAVRGVGFGDQVAELVPSVTDPMTLTLNKTLIYTSICNEISDAHNLYAMLPRNLLQLRQPRHGTIWIQDLTDNTCRV